MAENENENGNTSKRGRKPAEYSLPTFKSDVQNWLKSGKNSEFISRYQIQEVKKDDKGFVQSFEIISTPEFPRIADNRIEMVRLQTDGTYQYKPVLEVVSTWEYRNGKMVKVKVEETPA